jgi:hypothetical protein
MGALSDLDSTSTDNLNTAAYVVSLLHHAVPDHLPAVVQYTVWWYLKLPVRDWIDAGLPAALVSAVGEVTADWLMGTACAPKLLCAALHLALLAIRQICLTHQLSPSMW